MSTTSIKLVVGLCNPGAAYASTRHNAGGWFVDALVNHCSSKFKTEKSLQTELAVLTLALSTFRAMRPLTFMNHSGTPVRAVCQFYQIIPEEILVVHDDIDLPAGKLKLKTGGGHGGHNGLRDIIAQLSSPNFHRLRIGVGHPGHKDLVLNYVLSRPSLDDKQCIDHAIERAIVVMPEMMTGHFSIAMNKLHER